MKEIHLFEPTGYGGIFQHACQVAAVLGAHSDIRVVLHTGHQHELVDSEYFELCECSWWPRSSLRGRLRTKLKQLAIAGGLTTVTLPHLIRSTSKGSVLHLQGPCASGGMNYLFLRVARLRGLQAVYSPHNTFSRRGRVDAWLLEMSYRAANSIIVYSTADQERLQTMARRVFLSPLIQPVPHPSVDNIAEWRRKWNADTPADRVILCAGHIRPDKRFDLVIESARSWPKGVKLAVVGEDRGAWVGYQSLAAKYGLEIASTIDYVDLRDFTAAIAAADIVVVPSDRASQSGVLVVARQLGTPTIAANVGGLKEIATRTFTSGNPLSLSAAILAELSDPAHVSPVSDDISALGAHRRAYGLST